MRHISVILGACISSLAIASNQGYDILPTNFHLVKRADRPSRIQSNPQQGRSERSDPTSVLDLLSNSNLPQRPASSEHEEAQVSVDIHGPGRYSGRPTPESGRFQNHVMGGKRQSTVYHGSYEASATGVSYPYTQAHAPLAAARNMLTVQAKGKKVEELVSTAPGGAGHVKVTSPGERLPTVIPVPGDKSVRVLAQTPDPRGVSVQGSALVSCPVASCC